MGEARRPQPDLGDFQPVTHLHQAVFIRNFKPVKDQLAMPAMFFRAHNGNPAADMPARLIFMKQKRGQAFAAVF